MVSTLLTGITHYWKLDGGLLTDSVGSETLNNIGSTSITGKINEGRDFDGVSNYLYSSNTKIVVTKDQSYTVAGWVNLDVLGLNQYIFSQWVSSGNGYDNFRLALNTSNQITFQTNNDIGYKFGTSSTTISSGVWNHIILSVDYSGSAKVYINGILRIISTNGAFSYPAQNSPLWIGKYQQGNGEFHGKIDELGTWQKAFTDGGVALNAVAGGEVAELYSSGDGLQYPFSAPATGNPLALTGDL